MNPNDLVFDFPHTREDYDLLLEIDDTDDFETEVRTLVRERFPRPQQETV
jgi:hypothetical protein